MTVSGDNNLVCVGVITTVHGVRGNVKVKSFTRNAADFAGFGTLCDASGRRSFDVKIVGESKGIFLVQIDGITDRTAAEALRGTELYVARDKLPETAENEFYYADLIGMTAKRRTVKFWDRSRLFIISARGTCWKLTELRISFLFRRKMCPTLI